MKTFKQLSEELSKETDWTDTLSARELKDHLENNKAKKVFDKIISHQAYMDYHTPIATGNKTLFKHKIDQDGHHHIKTISTGNPKEYLHFISSKLGKIFTVNHNKIENTDGNKTISLIKRYE